MKTAEKVLVLALAITACSSRVAKQSPDRNSALSNLTVNRVENPVLMRLGLIGFRVRH